MGTTNKGYIAKEDFKLYDGVNTTFSRKTSSGGTQTLSVVDWFGLDVYAGFGTRDDAALQSAIDLVGNGEVIFFLSSGTWVLSNSITLPSNVYLMPSPGALIKPAAGITLTAYSPEHIIAPPILQIVDTGDNATNPIAFTTEGVVPTGWFGSNTSATINTAIACTPRGGTTDIHAGTFTISETVTASSKSIHIRGAANYGGAVSAVNRAFNGTIFNSTITNGDNVIELINNVDDVSTVNDSVYPSTKIENISILGNGSEGTGLKLGTTRTDGGETEIGGLLFSYVKNFSVEDVGGDGFYGDHYIWDSCEFKNINIVQPAGKGFHIINRNARTMARTKFTKIRTNYVGTWGFYLEGVVGATWDNCKAEHSGANDTGGGGWNFVDGGGTDVCKYNTFVNCAAESALFGVGIPDATALYMDSAFQNVFIGFNASSTDNPAVVMVGAQYNTFYDLVVSSFDSDSGAEITGPDSKLFDLDSTSYDNRFFDVYAATSNFDHIVEDRNATHATNLFRFSRLDPGVRGTTLLSSWTSEVCPPIILNFSRTKFGPVFLDRSAGFAISPMPLNFPTITATETLYVLSFDAGSVVFSPGQTVTGADSSATGDVRHVILESGNWSDSDAAGYLVLESAAGTPFTNNEAITDPLGGSATADGTGTEKANALDVSSIYRGVVDAGASPTTIAFFVGGRLGQVVKLLNRSEDTELVLDHGVYFRMQGGGDFTASKYDCIEFTCRSISGDNEEWWMTGLYEY